MAASTPRRCRPQQKDSVSEQSRSNETLANSQNMQQNVTSYVFGMGPATWTQPNQREGTMEHKGDQTHNQVQARTNNSTPTHNTTNILATASQPNIRNHEARRAYTSLLCPCLHKHSPVTKQNSAETAVGADEVFWLLSVLLQLSFKLQPMHSAWTLTNLCARHCTQMCGSQNSTAQNSTAV